jgi:hypothetical protein
MTAANAESSIADRLDKTYAPAWKPEPGDKIVGEITGFDDRDGGHGIYRIANVRLDDGTTVALHAFRKVLADELEEQNARVGDRLGVKYLGPITKAGGVGSYHGYKVFVEHKATDTTDGDRDEQPSTSSRVDVRPVVEEDNADLPF